MKNLLFTLLFLCTTCVLFSQNPPCEASIWPTDYENGVTTLSAIDSSGASVLSYSWSTGATTSEIGVTSEGQYCVTITFDNACTASACYTLSYEDCWSYASWWQNGSNYVVSAYGAPYYMEATYLWSNGSTAAQFLTTEPGTYCVTVTRENGCTSTSCVVIPGTPPPPACSVQIVPIGFENGTTTLAALDSAGTIVSYAWSNGANTPTINISTDGVYCVTAIFADGCVATDCDTFPDYCWSYASWAAVNEDEVVVSVIHSQDYLDATYEWNNGATTAQFTVTEPGYYSVTVTLENGCSSVASTYVTHFPNSLDVYVSPADSLSPGIIADVYLIQYDPETGSLSSSISQQTAPDGSGHAYFEHVPTGQYLVKAAIVPGTVGYAENLPTYYYAQLLWSDATYVFVSPNSWAQAYIPLIAGNNPGGPGFIGGLVSEGANLTGHTSEAEFSASGAPIAGASIILTLPDGTAVAAATTDATGAYSFPSLAYGTYVVTINIPGITPVSTTITISPAQPGFSGINFDVTENGAVLAAKEVDYEVFASVSPNPANDVVQVSLKESEGMLLVSNMQGQILLRQTVTATQMRLSLASLPAGAYTLTASTSKGAQSTRIIKK